jgi:hypothetical protein
MKYFIDAKIIEKSTSAIKQSLIYDANTNTDVTLESVKSDLLQKVIVPNGYRLSGETLTVRGKECEPSYIIQDNEKVVFTATLEALPKEKKK